MIIILSTSFTDDSTDRRVRVSSCTLSCLINGITTASEVEPMIAPKIKAGSISRLVSQIANPATIDIVRKKLIGANFIAPLKADRKVASLRVSPLSNKMMIKVIVVNIGPTIPNCAGDVKFRTGPKQMPIIIKRSTSGILVRLKIPVKRCARKTRIPTKATVEAISCIYTRR